MNSVQELRRPEERSQGIPLDAREFVARVILDGRFVADFQRDPLGVARRLNVNLTPEGREHIEFHSTSDLIAWSSDYLTENVTRRRLGNEVVSPMALNVIVILVIIFVLIPSPADFVRDTSPQASDKV